MTERTKQLKVRVSRELHKAVQDVAQRHSPPRTISDVVVGLCEEALKPPSVMDRDAIATRLGALEQKVKGLRLDIETLTELVSLFVYNWCCHTPSVADSTRQLAASEGALRFRDFLEVLHKRLEKGDLTISKARALNEVDAGRKKSA